MPGKEPSHCGSELDWVSPSRHIHIWAHRPGQGRRLKRQMSKRARRRWRSESEEQMVRELEHYADELSRRE